MMISDIPEKETKKFNRAIPITALELVLIALWVFLLKPTNAYYSVYFFCAAVSSAFCIFNFFAKKDHAADYKGSELFCDTVFAVIFSMMVLLANYNLFIPVKANFIKILIMGLGGIAAGFSTARGVREIIKNSGDKKGAGNNYSHRKAFLIVFITTLIIDVLYLLAVAYPGTITNDSATQINQILHGEYTNHHPFYHTIVIKPCIDFGIKVLGSINAGIAVYSVTQIIFASLIFAFAIMTLVQAGISKKVTAAAAVIYIFSPYNIAYSVTMWKDVPFALAGLLFVVALYRLWYPIGSSNLNLMILFLSALAFTLWRSNGWVAMVFITFILLLLARKGNRRIVLTLASVLLLSFVLKHQVLSLLDAKQPDVAEMFSIPEQQIAKVIADGKPLSEDELELIGKVVDIERVSKEYRQGISDPIKWNIRQNGLKYMETHKKELFQLWVELGTRYPDSYLVAWVNQTKGYWNSGYKYQIYFEGFVMDDSVYNEINSQLISGDRMAEKPSAVLKPIKSLFAVSFEKYYHSRLLKPLIAIGFHFWIYLLLFLVLTAYDRRRAILYVPGIAVVFTLMVATPVFSEFRYAYALMTMLSFLIAETVDKAFLYAEYHGEKNQIPNKNIYS